jgi:hypothetical protein
MNPEKQQIAIAEACGWKTGYRDPEAWHPLPDYLNDLNAMYEAEKIIPRQLFHVDYWQKGYGRFQQILSGITITPYSATATQRAEAFLRTIGKWEESR